MVVADDLLPSEAAELDWERVLAVATDQGSPTHHTSILARSLGIPAVVGLVNASREVPPGALVVVDGSRGELVLEPSAPMLAGFRDTQERARQEDEALRSIRGVPCVTRDGVRIHLLANAEFPDEADTAVQHGAEGIGLFRSEYLLGRSGRWPSEEQQVEVYRGLLERLRPWPVTVRTWDVGAEDLAPGGPTSANPALGQRASRLIGRDPAPVPGPAARAAAGVGGRPAARDVPLRRRAVRPARRPRPARRGARLAARPRAGPAARAWRSG